MSQTVETKVVELQFKSDDFAKKAEEASTRLELLNRKLDDFQRNGLSGITKSAKNVNIDSLGESVDETGKKFNALEKIATGALMTIGNYIARTGARLVSNLISPITSGGLQRAMNIEQASFQFEGLNVEKSKGNENLSYYKEVMDAVLGTAYSYDVAAKAASQLVASNVGVEKSSKKMADGTKKDTQVMNESMTKILMGIAGVASMSGSSFEDISQIFTTAAGKGKVQAEEFRRLAVRGLNASAVIAKALGVTEAEVSEMARKGQIDFQTFADAMADAYGSHAKDSTKMFQGAMEDLKAALARIGADFYGPALTGARDILNSITPLVDVLHEKIAGALTTSTTLLGKASQKATQFFDLLSYSLKFMERNDNDKGFGAPLREWIGGNLKHEANLLDAFGNTATAVKGAIDDLGAGLENFGHGYKIDGIKMLADYLNISMDDVEKGIEKGTIGLKEFDEALQDLYSQSSKFQQAMTQEELNEWMNTWHEAARNSDSGDKLFNTVDKLSKIFTGLKDVLEAVQGAFRGFDSIVGTVIVALEPLWQLLGKTVIAFAEFTSEILNYVADSKGFQTIIDGINSLLKGVTKLLHVTEITGAAAGLIIRIFDELAKAVKAVYDGVVKIVNTVIELLDHTIEKLAATFGNVTVIVNMIRKLGLFALFGALAKGIDSIFRPIEHATSIVDMLKNVFKSLENIFKNIEKLSAGVKGVFTNLAAGLKELTASIRADTVIKYAIALSMLAGSLYLLSQIDAEKAAQSVGLFGSTVAGLVASFAVITGILGKADKMAKTAEKGNFIERIFGKWIGKGADKYKSVGNFMIKMAASILILAAALKIIGDLPADKIIYATGAIELLMITLAGIAKVLAGTDKVTMSFSKGFEASSKRMTKGLAGLLAMAGAVYILAKAMENLSNLDPDKLATSFAFMSVILWELVGVVYAMSQFKANSFLKASVSLLIFAKAVEMFMDNLKILAEFDDQDALNNAMLKLAELIAMLTVASIAISQFGGMGILDAAAVYVFVQSITALVGGLQLLTTIDAEQLSNAFKYLVALMAILVVAVGALGAMGSVGLVASVAIYVFVQAIDVLVDSLLKIANSNLEAVGTAIIALAGAIFVLGASCAVFKVIPLGGILKFGLALGIIVVAAAGFGIAAFAIGLGMQAMAMGIEALAAVVPNLADFAAVFMGVVVVLAAAIAFLSPFTLALIGLGIAFAIFAASILGIGAGLQMLSAAIQTLTKLKDQLPSVASSLKTFFKSVKGLSKESSSLDKAAGTISTSLTKIGNAAAKAAESFAGFTYAGRKITSDLAKGITDNSTAPSNAVKTMLSKALSTSSSYVSKFYTVGANLTAGLVRGLNSQMGSLESAVQRLEAKAERAVKAKAEIKSPSKVWEKIGKFLGLGLVRGIDRSATAVVKASSNLASVSTDAMSSAVEIISNKLENGDFNPTITPIVDLSKATESANELGALFNSDPTMAATSWFGRFQPYASIDRAVSTSESVDNMRDRSGELGDMLSRLTSRLEYMTDTMNSRSLNVYNTIDGSADPEAFADGLIRSFRLNARTV